MGGSIVNESKKVVATIMGDIHFNPLHRLLLVIFFAIMLVLGQSTDISQFLMTCLISALATAELMPLTKYKVLLMPGYLLFT